MVAFEECCFHQPLKDSTGYRYWIHNPTFLMFVERIWICFKHWTFHVREFWKIYLTITQINVSDGRLLKTGRSWPHCITWDIILLSTSLWYFMPDAFSLSVLNGKFIFMLNQSLQETDLSNNKWCWRNLEMKLEIMDWWTRFEDKKFGRQFWR